MDSYQTVRINAREADVYDLTGFRHYLGPNPWIGCEAMVFDVTLTGAPEPMAPEALAEALAARLPDMHPPEAAGEGVIGQARVLAAGASAVIRLGMGLHMERLAVHDVGDGVARVAVECLHKRTAWDGVFLLWDLVEAIHADDPLEPFDARLEALRDGFGASVFGGPTTYALWRAAALRDVPVHYLWDEGLVRYGYGRRQRRGAATTFDLDSQLDSDFTTRKDDCKDFLESFGFPTPTGRVVESHEAAEAAAEELGYPVVVKPLSGHKGKGVTANVETAAQLREAVDDALAAPNEQPGALIVETYLAGDDHRLLCVDGDLVAAVRRRPAHVTGDGESTIAELIDAANALPERADTPTTPMGKIVDDAQMRACLGEQGLSVESVLEAGREVALRKVANLSLGGVSEAVTDIVHPDNAALCRAVAQHLRLVCLGIDVLAEDISRSWKEGGFGIIEINAAPGISMHLRPAVGRPVDVPGKVIETLFPRSDASRIPIVALNRLEPGALRRMLDAVLSARLDINPGGCCAEAVLMRRDAWPVNADYGSNIRNLLRTPTLDLLVAECPESLFAEEGLPFDRADIVALEEPTATERGLADYVRDGGTVLIREGLDLTVRRGQEEAHRRLAFEDEFLSVVVSEMRGLLE